MDFSMKHVFVLGTFLFVYKSETVCAAFTWASCMNGPTKSYCTDVFSTACCSSGIYANAHCCKLTSCPSYNIGGVPTALTCQHYSQSKCCPRTPISGRVAYFCCDSVQYSITSSMNSVRSVLSSSRSSSISRASSLASKESSSRESSRRSRSAESRWRSYESRMSSSLREVLDIAQAAQSGATAAGSILGILIVVLLVLCIVAARSSSASDSQRGGSGTPVLVSEIQGLSNRGMTSEPVITGAEPAPTTVSPSRNDAPPPSYEEVQATPRNIRIG